MFSKCHVITVTFDNRRRIKRQKTKMQHFYNNAQKLNKSSENHFPLRYLGKNDFLEPTPDCPLPEKIILQNTPLFRLLSTMPKGAILHLHLLASFDLEEIVSSFLFVPIDSAVVLIVNVDRDDDEFAHFKLVHTSMLSGMGHQWEIARQVKEESPDLWEFIMAMQSMNVTSIDYEKKRHAKIARDFAGLDRWTILERITDRIGSLLKHKDAFARGFEVSLLQLAKQKVQIVEYRGSVWNIYEYIDQEPGSHQWKKSQLSGLETLSMMHEIHSNLRLKHPLLHIPEFGIILSTGKGMASEELNCKRLTEFARVAFALVQNCRRERRDLLQHLLGFDLYGEEDRSHLTEQMFHVLKDLELKSKEEDLQDHWKYFLHAGENYVLYRNNLNLQAALGLDNLARIGHGLRLPFQRNWPAIAADLRRRNICVELCPISNQILHYVDNMSYSPGVIIMQAQVGVTLSPDDLCIFGYNDTAFDFAAAAYAWNLTFEDLYR